MPPKKATAASASRAKKVAPASRATRAAASASSTKHQVAKKQTTASSTKDVTKKKKNEPKVVPEPSVAPSKKRGVGSEPSSAPRPSKRLKTGEALNTAPSQKLDVYVFGSGDSGELGLGHVTRNGKKPRDVRRPRLNDFLDASNVGVVQIAVGGMHCVALTHDGKILTWGVNDNGALGRDTTWEAPTRDIDAQSDSEDDDSGLNPIESTPTAISTGYFSKDEGDLVQVAATDSASFVLTSKGSVYGWGTFSGSDGNIGFSKTVNRQTSPDKQETPTLIPSLKNITSLAAGGNHMLALDHRGAIYGWGCGQQSQLGRPIMESYRTLALTPSLVRLPPRKSKNKITSIAAGQFHSFALSATGEVYAWGLNNFAQTGIYNAADDHDDKKEAASALIVPKPTLVKTLSAYASSEYGPVTALAGGNHHSLALTSSGHVLSWGRCDASQAGVPLSAIPSRDLVHDDRGRARIVSNPTIVPIPAPDDDYDDDDDAATHVKHETESVAFVAAGIDDCIVLAREGSTAYSWGFSASYRTGLGTEEAVEMPARVENGAVRGRRLTWAGCGGQFGVLAGPAGGG